MINSTAKNQGSNKIAEKTNNYIPPVEDDPLLESIYEAARNINSHALFEFAVDPYPPKVAQEVIEAVCMLLGLQLDWNMVKDTIFEEKLTPMILSFHPESVPDIYLEQISQIANLPEMQIENLEKQSLGIKQLGEWIHAIAIYYDVKHRPELYKFLTEHAEPEVVPEVEKPKEAEVPKIEEKKDVKKKENIPVKRVSIKEALESIKNLNKQDIVEVRTYATPPAAVLLVLEAVCILFDSMKVVKRSGNQIIYEPNYKKLMQDTDLFIRKVLTLDYDKIPKDKIKKLREYIKKPGFEIDKVKKGSAAAASFSLLIISIVQKYDEQKV